MPSKQLADHVERIDSARRSETMCLGCGAATCSGCLTEFDAPRHCPRCGRKSRLKVHPAGWSAVCKSCGIEIRSP